MPIDHEYQTEDECNATHEEKVHPAPSLAQTIRGENGRILRGPPEVFMRRLGDTLQRAGIDIAQLDSRTTASEPPPCFEMNKADYAEWLRYGAAAADIPVRLDMPAEPNYCIDCTPQFKKAAVAAGTCLFPNTRFEVRRIDGEKETIGVSRSGQQPPDDYVVYQEMVVPRQALAEALRRYFDSNRVRVVARVPKRLRGKFEKLTRPRMEETHEQ